MEDNEISWGKPSFEEIREYFTTPNTRVDPRSVIVQPSSDSSIDLDDSFKAILEERRRKAETEANRTPPTANHKKTPFRTPGNRLLFEKTPSGLSMDGDQSSWMNCGDDTFLNMEKMCENTVLENTLEAAAVDRLLNEFETETSAKRSGQEMIKNLNDMTQLNDIEAPSMMWEQTILNVNSPKASPLKMVHMLRPSTIIEESTFYNSTKDGESVIHRVCESGGEEKEDFGESGSSDAISDGHISLNTTNNESFETAKAPETTADNTNYETANDQTLASNATSKILSDELNVFPMKKKRNFYDASFAQSLSLSTVSSTASDDSLFNIKYEKNSAFLDSLDVIEVSSKETTAASVPNEDDDEDEGNASDLLEAPDFNDTLEEMDFIMKHGQKFMEQQKSASKSEKSATPVLKQKNLNTGHDSATKKVTPNPFKKPQAISRLPVPKSTSKKFDHIVSPIHAYIKDAPQYPLMTKQKGRMGLFDQLHDPHRRDTVYSQNNENLFVDDPSYKPTIPLKGVISATKSQVYDARTPIKMPGGEKVHKLIGNHTPTVVKHEGRFKSYANVKINADDTVDESFANLSVASGDVSIQVVKNVNRV